MTSFIGDLLSNNFFEKCVNDSFLNLNCVLGSSSFGMSILVVSFNCFAFYKLFKFFHKVNFETSLILLNIIELLIIQLLIITCYAILIICFNFVQIGMLTWIIRKFNILLKNPLKFFKKNKSFVFLNIINILLFIYYIVLLFIKDSFDYNYPVILFHSFLSLFCSCILVIKCCSLINKIKGFIISEKKSIQIVNDLPNEKNNELLLNKENQGSNNTQEFIFYCKREKQIKPLYKINFICTFLEFSLVLSVGFVSSIDFEKVSYKIIPESVMSHIFYYLFIFVCIINTFTNFFCFYWMIKSQYKINPETKNKFMTNKYLKKQKMEIDNDKDEPNIIEEIIEEDLDNENNNKFEDDEFNSFEDLFIDNQNNNKNCEPDLVKPNDDIFSDDSFEKNGKENIEYLNNEINKRESIDLDIDSRKGINRVSQATISIQNEEK